MAASNNPYFISPPNVYEALMAGYQGYDTANKRYKEQQQRDAMGFAAKAIQAGDHKAALAALMASGNLQGAQIANQMYNQSPAGITASETAKAEVANRYAPKTSNMKLPNGEEVTVEKGPGGYTIPTVQGLSTAPDSPIPVGVDPKEYRKVKAHDAAKLAIEQPKTEAHVADVTSNLDRLKQLALELKQHPGLSRSTGLVGAFPTIPGSAAADFEAQLESFKSQVGLGVLQSMRDASKTGGAVGQVSNFEQQLFQNNLAGLHSKQSNASFVKSLDKIINYADQAKGRITGAYQKTYGTTPPFPGPRQQTAPRAAVAPNDGHINALRQNPALANQFDAKFGPGSAAQVLGQ